MGHGSRRPDSTGRAGRGRGVIFDLDGTLVDTNYLHVVAWWEAFGRHNRMVSMPRVHALIGRNGPDLVTDLAPDAQDNEIEAIVSSHAVIYRERIDEVAPTPGAGDLLTALSAAGLSIAVATSAKPDEVDPMLSSLGADDAIEFIVDSSEVKRGKPAPDIVDFVLDRADLSAGDTVLVGDSVWDVESAQRAGVECIALQTGGTDPLRLSAAGADAVYADCGELLTRLSDSPLARLLRAP